MTLSYVVCMHFAIRMLTCAQGIAIVSSAMERFYFQDTGRLFMASLALAEVTNPLQITFLTSKEYGYATLNHLVSLPFTAFYVIVRMGMGWPLFAFWIYDAFIQERPLASVEWGLYFTTVCFFLMMLGSTIWAKKAVTGYRKYQAKQAKAAASKKAQ